MSLNASQLLNSSQSLNSSDADCGLFCYANALVHLTFSIVFSLPGFTLSVLFMVAIFMAKDINWKVRVIMINLLAPKLFNTFGLCFNNFRYLIWAFDIRATDKLCNQALGTTMIGYLGDLSNIPFFAVSVYIITKFDEKKLKWLGIAAYSTLSWPINMSMGAWVASTNLDSRLLYGFCFFNFNLTQSPAVVVLIFYISILMIAGLCITLIFSTLTYCYVKKNTISSGPDSSSPVKRALKKVLIFESAKAVTLIILYMMNVGLAFFQLSSEDQTTGARVLIVLYARKFVFELIYFLSPVTAISFLKPVRDALKQIWKAKCIKNSCSKN